MNTEEAPAESAKLAPPLVGLAALHARMLAHSSTPDLLDRMAAATDEDAAAILKEATPIMADLLFIGIGFRDQTLIPLDPVTGRGLMIDDLFRRGVRNAIPRHGRTTQRWVAIQDAFALGGTFAYALCRRMGLNPEDLITSSGAVAKAKPRIRK